MKTTQPVEAGESRQQKSCKSAGDVRLVLFLNEGSKNTLQSAILALKIRLNGLWSITKGENFILK